MKTKGLTLKEAVESGKPFRRAGWVDFCVKSFSKDDYNWGYRIHDIIDIDDAVATDWEIKAEPRELWVGEYRDALGDNAHFVLYTSKQIAEKDGDLFPKSFIRVFKVVEVSE